ncbi:unnamed protein product, partial [Brassica rapa]
PQDVLCCVLPDTHGRPVCTEHTAHWAKITQTTDTHGHTRTATYVLCVLTDTHGRLCVRNRQPTRAKITRIVHGEGQRAESKDQRADIQPTWAKITRTVHEKVSVLSPRTNVLICVLMDSHERLPQTSCVCRRTPTDVLCVLNRQPSGTKSPKQSTERARVLSPRTNVLICVLMDSHGRPVHGRPVCAGRHTRTVTDVLCVMTDSHRYSPRGTKSPKQSTGRARVLSPRTNVLIYSPRGPKSPEHSTGRVSVLSPRTNVLICVLMDSHGRPPQTSCVCWRTPTDVLCVLNRQPMWAKMTQTVHGKGQRDESKDQRADMCTDGQPRTSCVC